MLKFSPSSFGPSHLGPHQKNLALLKLTAVCRRWRSTASECATLWTSIAFSTSVESTIQCATVFLGRSKQAMLSVHIWDSGSPRVTQSCKEFLRVIAGQSHRFSTCELSSSSPSFWGYWSSPAPNLCELTVQGHGVETSPIFSRQVPRLESITSFHYTPWRLGNYTALRQADLWNNGRQISLTSLLGALRGCQTLEKLSLHGYSSLSRGVPRPVSLPHLVKIDLFSSDAGLILEHLETPSLAGPVIIFDSNPGRDILRSLPRTRGEMPYLHGIVKLYFVLNSYSTQYHVAGYREDGTLALYIGVSGVEQWFRWRWARASIEAVASFPHFSTIRNLVFSTDTFDVPWHKWLPNLGHLCELTVTCPRSDGLLVSLLGTSLRDGLPICPSLSTLALY